MKRIIELAKAHPKLAVAAVLINCALLAYIFVAGRSAWHSRSVNKQDAEIQQSIDQNAKSAEASESNANAHRDSRQNAEGRAALADEQREQARINSSRTLEPVRKARQKHEEVRKSRPADYPDLTDEQLCAELTKRGIPCQ